MTYITNYYNKVNSLRNPLSHMTFDEVWDDLLSLFDETPKCKNKSINTAQNVFSKIIGRPHNLYVEKTDDVITKYIVEMVYTPWKADLIKVTFTQKDDEPKLIISIGNEENKPEADVEEKGKGVIEVYRGISEKPIKFEIPLTGIKVNPKDVTTNASEGILTIEIKPDYSDLPKDVEIPIN